MIPDKPITSMANRLISAPIPLLVAMLMVGTGCDNPDPSPKKTPSGTADSAATAAGPVAPDSSQTVAVQEDSSDLRYFADINPSLKQDPVVLAYLRKHVVERPEYMRFIEIREKRRSIAVRQCDETMIDFADTLASGNSYSIRIDSRKFDSTRHRLGWNSDKNEPEIRWVERIDGRSYYGTDGFPPTSEIASFLVTINGRDIRIPKSAYDRFYNLSFCTHSRKYQYIEAYESSDGKHLYIYMEASDGAGAYSVKMVFDHTTWITSMAERLDFSGNAVMDGLNEPGISQSDVDAPVERD